MSFKFRPHQEIHVAKGIEFFTQKKHPLPQIIVSPTGGGKSFDIAGIATGVQKVDTSPILVLQPKVELLMQNVGKYESFGFAASVYCAGANNRKEIGFVTYATLDSIMANIKDFVNAGFKNIIVDECDSGYPSEAGSMFDKLLKALESKGAKVRLLGFTATPFRTVNSLSGTRIMMLNKVRPAIFKGFLHITQIKEIADRYWSPLEYVVKKFDGSMLKVNQTGTEYTDTSLELFEKSNFANIYNACIDPKFNHVLCFMKSIKQCELMQRAVPNSAIVHAKTPTKDRGQIVKDFKSGKIRVLINVGVFKVGFDFPELDHIIPPATNSLSMWYQIVGRGVRLPTENTWYKTYTHCTITDVCGMYDKFGRVEDITIEMVGKNYEVFCKGKQVTSIEMKTAFYTPPVASCAPSEFIDLTFDFGRFPGQKISQVPEWYLQSVKDHFHFKPKFQKQASIYLQIKAINNGS